MLKENSGEENAPKEENEDEVPKGQTEKSLKMKAGTVKRSGSKTYDDTPLPEEEDDENSVDEDDDAEDQRPGEKARSSQDEEEIRKKAEADEDARYQ